MRNSFLAVLCAILSVINAQLSADETLPYVSLDLPPPQNWVLNLGSVETISTYNEPDASYNATSWTKYIIEECKRYDATSCVTNSQITTGAYNVEQPYRVWFGIICGGSPLSASDFRRGTSENSQIRNATAYVKQMATQGSQSSIPSATSTSAGSSIVQTLSETATQDLSRTAAQSTSNPTASPSTMSTSTGAVTTTNTPGMATSVTGKGGITALLLSVIFALGM